MGDYLAGPLYDQEGILYADLESELLVQAKYDFDVTGHYARPDVFRLLVDESPHDPVARSCAAEGADSPGPHHRYDRRTRAD